MAVECIVHAQRHAHVRYTQQLDLNSVFTFSLRHRNLNSFFGVCDNAPEFRIHWEYCSRESLHDVIQRSYLPVGWAFRTYWMRNLSKGEVTSHIFMNEVFEHAEWNVFNCDYGGCQVLDRRRTHKRPTIFPDCPGLFDSVDRDILFNLPGQRGIP
ncbi:guanylate cyclase 2D/E/F [Clonorchis sinensis]|uniref:Guanylate cyclase 2D/E/F n=1 Tax=Clonorchis sinensis TaxID=79923 RepID=G7YQY6_CLOSI|nr:guanylate cyclase 2D/E/F [Clonorchis sinensis]